MMYERGKKKQKQEARDRYDARKKRNQGLNNVRMSRNGRAGSKEEKGENSGKKENAGERAEGVI